MSILRPAPGTSFARASQAAISQVFHGPKGAEAHLLGLHDGPQPPILHFFGLLLVLAPFSRQTLLPDLCRHAGPQVCSDPRPPPTATPSSGPTSSVLLSAQYPCPLACRSRTFMVHVYLATPQLFQDLYPETTFPSSSRNPLFAPVLAAITEL